jgi:hypothetical protein
MRKIGTAVIGAMLALMVAAPMAFATPSNQAGPSNGNADFLGSGPTTAEKAPAARPGNS